MSRKTVVITGGGQGIGRAAALHFAERGWDCVLIGRTAEKLEAAAAEAADRGSTAHVIPMDVTDLDAVATLTQRVTRADCLINSAGESLIKPLSETTPEDWERILNTNLRAPYFVIKALLPALMESDNPSILNVGSKTTFGGYPEVSAYTASKAGLLGLTRALAAELRPHGVRVVLLAPGPADTPMRWAATPDFDPKLLVQPATIAEALYWLATLPHTITTSEFLLQSTWFES